MATQSNHKKLVVVSLLLLLGMQFLVPQYAAASERSDKSKMLEFPWDAQRFNLTELIPHYFKHEFEVGFPQLIQFRNMTMLINATRNMELNITADPEVNMRYFALSLNLNRSIKLNIQTMAGPPADIPRPEDGIGRYLAMEPNTTAWIRATLRLHLDPEDLNLEMNRYVEMWRLRWAFWNGTGWEPVTSWMDEQGFLVAEAPLSHLWTIREMRRPPTIPSPEIPGIPVRARAYNYTMVVPRTFRWTIRERGGVVFAFRNMAMMFNSTSNLELNITAGNNVTQRLFRLELRHGSPLRLNMEMQLGPPAGIPEAARGLGFYLGIEPNTTVPVNARLGLLIEREAIEAQLGREIDPQRLRWAWWNGTRWVEVESALDEDKVLVGETGHFSTWTIVETEEPEPEPEPEPQPEPEPEPEPEQEAQTQWILYGGFAAIILGAAILLYIMRRKP